MEKNKLIRDIENYYPIDCEYPDTALIGEQILIRAMQAVKFDWRTLPHNVLSKCREMCFNEENDGEITSDLKERGLI